MNTKEIPELKSLLAKVEQTYGRPIRTTANFEALSVVIEHEINENISASTLKRLWGYIPNRSVPRKATLDVLARYVGERDYLRYCDNLRKNAPSESAFFSAVRVAAADLEPGTLVRLGWNPNRLVVVESLGGFRFRVCRNYNSSLREGDEFEVASFLEGLPLYIPNILRDGEPLPAYVAGSINGLTLLEVVR